MADIRTGSKYLMQIERAIEEIQMKQHVPQNLEVIRKMLNLEFKANCEKVYLTNNTTQSYFFGAHVFPSKKELYNIADKVVRVDEKVKFEYCRDFVIELDSKLIYDISATPREITAALLHEIGHKVYSKQAQIRSKMLLFQTGFKYGGIAYSLVKFSSLKFILFTAIISVFSNSLSSWLKLKDELDADSFAVKYGYAVDLHSLLNKLTKDSSLSLGYGFKGRVAERSVIGTEESQKAMMSWSYKNMVDFSIRKSEILKTLKQQLREEPSDYGKEILQEQIDQIEKSMRRKSTINLSIKNDNMVNESIKSFIEMQTKGRSPLELEEISVESDRIDTHEDKLYLVTRIHRNITLAQKSMDKLPKDINPSNKMKRDQYLEFINDCNELLKKVRDTKIKKNDFTVLVKYPAGDYETL